MNNMIDKIDRLNKHQAVQGTILYRNGNVYFNTTGEIAALEIDYVGNIKAINKLGEGWNIKAGKNKILIYSFSQTPLTELLFTYVGQLQIIKCIFVNWNLEAYNANIVFENNSLFGTSKSIFSNDHRKYEEIAQKSYIKKRIKKTII